MALYTETRVKLAFEIEIKRAWKGKTTFHQACDKAVKEAKQELRTLLKKAKHIDIDVDSPLYTTASISVSKYYDGK